MTHADLHNSFPNFAELFEDPRFKALLIYLRANPAPRRNVSLSDATAIIRSEGAFQAWYELLDTAEQLRFPPKSQTPPLQTSAPYTTKPPQSHA